MGAIVEFEVLVAEAVSANVHPPAVLTSPDPGYVVEMGPCLYQISAGPVAAVPNTADAPVINTGDVADTSNIVAPPPPLFGVFVVVLTVDWAHDATILRSPKAKV
jgi:hypothetical protein